MTLYALLQGIQNTFVLGVIKSQLPADLGVTLDQLYQSKGNEHLVHSTKRYNKAELMVEYFENRTLMKDTSTMLGVMSRVMKRARIDLHTDAPEDGMQLVSFVIQNSSHPVYVKKSKIHTKKPNFTISS
jgi:hypothetical protein